MLSIFFYRYIYYLILFSIINIIISNEENIIILNQYEYELNISKYYLTVLNLNRELYNMKYSLMAYINELNFNVNNIFTYYTPYYNHYWLFFISDINIFKEMISKYKCINDYMIIYGIIIPKNLASKLPKEFSKVTPPIFYIDDNYTNFLEESDFRKNDKIIYYSFESEKPISKYPEAYFLFASLLIFSISCFILMFWNIFYRIAKDENITSIQKYCNFLPYLNLILSILLLIKCLYIKGKDPYLHYEYMTTIDSIFISMNSITKIVIWYFLVMVSTGWQIAIKTLSKKIQIFYIKMIIFIFLMICIDITIYNINENAFNNFCEFKNIIFYLITTVIILKEIKITTKLLFKKLHYAETLIPEFSDGLLFKIKLFNQLKIIIFCYPIIFVITFIIHLIIPDEYDSTCLKFVDHYFNDIILLIYLLIVFGPKVLPPNYDVDFAKDLENDSGKIYKLTIQTNNDGSLNFNPLDKKDIIKIREKKSPIIIFGQTSNENRNNISSNKYNFIINNADEEKDINKLYSTIELGFSE